MAFGRPITARRVSSAAGSGSPSGNRSTIRSSRSPAPETLRGGHGRRIAEPEPVELGRERHVLDTVICSPATITGRSPRRRSANSASRSRSPARASTASTATAASAKRRERLLADLTAQLDASPRSRLAARVDQREAAATSASTSLPVARHARARIHHGGARSAEAVDRRRLAGVRVAEDGDLHGRAEASAAGIATP